MQPLFQPTPHPYVPWLSDAEIAALMALENGAEELAALYNEREAFILRSETDPFHHVFLPSHTYQDGVTVEPWRDAESLAAEADVDIVGIFGGNRSAKSYFAAWLLCQNLYRCAGSLFVCLAEKEDTSITQQQSLIWHFMHPDFKRLQNRRDPRSIFKVNYSQANGFADRKAVFPNRSELHFLTYNQIATDYEGWEFGSKSTPIVAVWADESLPLSWLQMFHRRLKFRRAKMLWTFTAVKGITPAMKEMLGKTCRTTRHLPAALLPEMQWHDCPRGRMPYIQMPEMARCRAIYFHSIFNQFHVSQTPDAGGRLLTYYDQITAQCENKPGDYIARIAYGAAKDTIERAFPKFGPWNVVSSVPDQGTNYRFVDPAGRRNWFIIWVRVTPGPLPDYYIYREWPDVPSYGEWAVPTEREVNASSNAGWDGDPGPAQVNLGMGVASYKKMFLEKEGGETVLESYMDSRAGANPHADETGSTCLLDLMNEPQLEPGTGKVLAPAMPFLPASGVKQESSVTSVNELLDWKTQEPLVPLLNAPRLYIHKSCENVIWAMSNYTGRGGEMGACKDPVDLVRYMAMAQLLHVAPGSLRTRGGGSL